MNEEEIVNMIRGEMARLCEQAAKYPNSIEITRKCAFEGSALAGILLMIEEKNKMIEEKGAT